jgi:hypothetical protein
MPLTNDHTLSFNWSGDAPAFLIDEYYIDTFVNENFIERVIQSSGDAVLTVESLFEGDQVRLEIIPSLDEALFVDDTIFTETQSVPIANFNNSGVYFTFDNLLVDGSSNNFTEVNSKYYFTGSYYNPETEIDLLISNPRDGSTVSPLEPFFSGIRYQVTKPRCEWDISYMDTAIAWYDPSDSTTLTFDNNGDLISAADKTSNNHTLTARNSNKIMPEISSGVQNGLAVFEFSRNDGVVASANTLVAKDLAISDLTTDSVCFLMVTKNTYTDNQSFLLTTEQEVTNPRIWGAITYPNESILIKNGTDQLSITNALDKVNPHIAGIIFDNTNTRFRRDGSLVAQNTDTNKTFDDSDISSVNFGHNEVGQQSIRGFIGEIVVLSNFDDSDVEKVEGYLAHKWGLADNLPSSHPYKTETPYVYPQTGCLLTTGFNEDVSLTIDNTLNSERSFDVSFVAEDIYSGSVTGLASFNHPILEIQSATFSLLTGYDSHLVPYNLFANYNHEPNYLEYKFYSDSSFQNLIKSGISYDIYSSTGHFFDNATGYLKLTPYNWFGSGETYTYPNPIITFTQEVQTLNYFEGVAVQNNLSGFNWNFDVSLENDIGSFIEYSIDSSPNYSFNNDSYQTGTIPFTTGDDSLIFDTLASRTGTHEDFYYTFYLYSSGTRTLEDSKTGILNSAYPSLTTGISYDYFDGVSSLNVSSNYGDDERLSILYSSDYNTDTEVGTFSDITGSVQLTGELYPSGHFKLVRSDDYNNVYDEANIKGQANRPVLTFKNITFSSLESSTNIVLIAADDYINGVDVYRKAGFLTTEGTTPSHFQDILTFNDYQSHAYESNIPIGHYIDLAPDTVPARNSTIQYSADFSYSTGLYYLYQFIPFDGYGTGHRPDPQLLTYSINNIAKSVDGEVVTTTARVDTTESEISTITGSIDSVDQNARSGFASNQSGIIYNHNNIVIGDLGYGSGVSDYTSFLYANSILTGVRTFQDNTETSLMHSKGFTYDSNGRVTQIVERNATASITLTKNIVYDANGNITSIENTY